MSEAQLSIPRPFTMAKMKTLKQGLYDRFLFGRYFFELKADIEFAQTLMIRLAAGNTGCDGQFARAAGQFFGKSDVQAKYISHKLRFL